MGPGEAGKKGAMGVGERGSKPVVSSNSVPPSRSTQGHGGGEGAPWEAGDL